MVSSRERSRSARRRIAGERSRPAGTQATPETQAPETQADSEAPDMPAPVDGDAHAAQSPEAQEAPAEGAAAPAAPEAADVVTAEEPDQGPGTRGDRAGGTPTWVLMTLAALLVAALAVDGVLFWKQQQDREQAERALHSAVTVAPSVAERAAEAVLSYRHNTFDKDVAEARRYLSEEYRPDYVASIKDVVAKPAQQIGAVVKAKVLASGVVEASGERASVLLFVNQTTTSAADTQSRTALNRVVFTMVPRDGAWKVDEIKAF